MSDQEADQIIKVVPEHFYYQRKVHNHNQQVIAVINNKKFRGTQYRKNVQQDIDSLERNVYPQNLVGLRIEHFVNSHDLKNLTGDEKSHILLEPLSFNPMIGEIVNNEKLKVKEIMKNYELVQRYKLRSKSVVTKKLSALKQRACNPISWAYNKMTGGQPTNAQAVFAQIENPDLVYQNSTIKCYTLDFSGTLMAAVGYNDCIHFINISTQKLLNQQRLFNRRQYQARGIMFSPTMPEILVIWGKCGLVVWNLQEQQGRHKHGRETKSKFRPLFAKEHDYLSVTFSNSGKFMACIFLENTIPAIEMYNLNRSESYDKPVRFPLAISLYPAYAAFSPQDRYLLISEVPRGKVNNVRIYDTKTDKVETWNLVFENENQVVRQALWSHDEVFMFLHASQTNVLQTFMLNKATRSQSSKEDELIGYDISYSEIFIKDHFVSFYKTFLKLQTPIYQKRPESFNFDLPKKEYQITQMTCSVNKVLLMLYESVKSQGKDGSKSINEYLPQIENRIMVLFKWKATHVPEIVIQFDLICKIDTLLDCIPKCIDIRFNRIIISKESDRFLGREIFDKDKHKMELLLSYVDDFRDNYNVVFVKI
ncbi:UNKNOWN [Stylonychia lemnae]|uniref:Uncharacterized protein n=1 Tax=Stylonychia lemnae TaxID=5949 RepID=A0A078AV74_STYLE|nr:UNKNOWN [Stylonychia lemnae]|eukprot:CDW85896.1 UNKNOWN [Stylonychia lemnae]